MYELKKWKGIYEYICWDQALVLWKKEFTGPRSHEGWETLVWLTVCKISGRSMFIPRDSVGTCCLRVQNAVKSLSPPAKSFRRFSLGYKLWKRYWNWKGLPTWNILCTPLVRLEARCWRTENLSFRLDTSSL